MAAPKVIESIVKCPKCKHGKNITLIELWKDHEITWEQINGKFDLSDGNLEMGNPYKVEARCNDCKHQWTVRKVLQIDDIIK